MASSAATAVTGKVFTAMVMEGVAAATPFAQVSRDYSGEVTGGGSSLNIPLGVDTLTLQDYSPGTNMTATSYTATGGTLTLDKLKAVNVPIEDVDETQTFFSLLQDASSATIRTFAQQLGSDFRAALGAASTGVTSLTISLVKENEVVAADISKLYAEIADAVAGLRSKGEPGEIWVSMPQAVWKAFVLNNAIDRLQGGAQSRAFDAGLVDNVLGARVIPDYLSNSATDPWVCYVGVSQRTLVHGIQINNLENIRHPDRFATIMRGLIVYGVAVPDGANLYKITLDK